MDSPINMAGAAVLLVTDSYRASVNGISVFSEFFVQDMLLPRYPAVYVFETTTGILYTPRQVTSNEPVELSDVYVNAHYSAADNLVRQPAFAVLLQEHGLRLAARAKYRMISHGWTCIRWRTDHYSIYYNIRNWHRSRQLQRLRFYDETIFISEQSDAYRHKDLQYCRAHHLPVSFYDFTARFIEHYKRIQPKGPDGQRQPRIAVVANFQPVKNLWWLIGYNLRRRIKGRPPKKFSLLTVSAGGVGFKLFSLMASFLSITLVTDQQQKPSLLQSAAYLFIPSYTEYNPIVALEAAASGARVASLYRIPALSCWQGYHYLRD